MDNIYVFHPIVTSSVVAIFVCTLVLIILFKNRVAIGQMLALLRTNIFTRTGFFWLVNIVFMGVSVLHAGAFFGITGKDDFAHYLGFAVSFFLDLVTIILMQAMLEARYRGDEPRARQFLFFITLCCGTSTFANLAISLNNFDPLLYLPHAPEWVQVATPYILASFPLFVIMMSIAAEMIINVRPLEQLDEEEYEADEKKRLKIMQIRNTYLQMQADEELRALSIRAQMRLQRQLRKGSLPGSFRWPWEAPANTKGLTSIVATHLKTQYEPKLQELQQKIESMQREKESKVEELQKSIDYRQREKETELQELQQSVGGGQTLSQRESVFSPFSQLMGETVRSKSVEDIGQTSGEIQINAALFEVTKRYPRVASEWLTRNRKTATLEEIMEVTGHSKRRLNRAVLRRSSRNPDLVLLSSVIEWLKTAPLPTLPQNDGQNNHKETVMLDEYSEMLV
jgi:hypothetical protein